MHILFEEESGASIEEIIAREGESFYCIPSTIADVIQQLRQEIRQHVCDLGTARRMEHRLLLLESLTAAQGTAGFWSAGTLHCENTGSAA